MENKKFRQILVTIWGMVFCIDLIFCLVDTEVHPISWLITGFVLGGIFIMSLDTPLLNLKDKCINLQYNVIKTLREANKKYSKFIDEKIKEIKNKRGKKGGKLK